MLPQSAVPGNEWQARKAEVRTRQQAQDHQLGKGVHVLLSSRLHMECICRGSGTVQTWWFSSH